jgi:hypothetical protein
VGSGVVADLGLAVPGRQPAELPVRRHGEPPAALHPGGIYADGVSPTDVASAYFDGSQQTFDAIVLDLLGNIIETAGYATDTGAGTAIASIISLTGAGIGTADALAGDPDTVVNTTAENLDSELSSYFCPVVPAHRHGNAAAPGLLSDGADDHEGPLLPVPGRLPHPRPCRLRRGAATRTSSRWDLAASPPARQRRFRGWRRLRRPEGQGEQGGNAVRDGFRSGGRRLRVRLRDADVCEYGIGDICTYGPSTNTSCKGSDKGDDA